MQAGGVSKLSRQLSLSPFTAVLMLCLAAVCFGLVPLFAKNLQALGVDSSIIAISRFCLSALVLAWCLPLARHKWRTALKFFGTGLLVGVGWAAYAQSLQVVSVAQAGVIYMCYPLFVTLMGWAILRRQLTQRSVVSASLILLAALMTMGDVSGLNLSWDGGTLPNLLLALMAPIAFALVVLVVSEQSQVLTALERLGCIMLGAVVSLAPIAGQDLAAMPTLTPEIGFWLLGTAVLTAFVPQLLHITFAPKAGASQTAATGALELPMMFVLGAIAFGEILGPAEILAGGLVLAAVFVAPGARTSVSTSALIAGVHLKKHHKPWRGGYEGEWTRTRTAVTKGHNRLTLERMWHSHL